MAAEQHYLDFLASKHREAASPELIGEMLSKGTTEKLTSKNRIIAGEANEVYDIGLESGRHVILRISREPGVGFEQERWAIEKCKAAGVPVPSVVYIGEENKLAFCIQEKLPGEPLERGAIDLGSLPTGEQAEWIHKAGAMLAKIHSIPTRGFGNIDENGVGKSENAEGIFDHYLKNKDHIIDELKEAGLSPEQAERAISLISFYKPLYAKSKPVLNHGDFGHKHILVDGKDITGIIDFGEARSDSAVFDFARWDLWYGDFIPTQWLKEGYTNKELFDENFDNLLHVIRMTVAIDTISWYQKQGYKEMVELLKKKLLEDLEYFKT